MDELQSTAMRLRTELAEVEAALKDSQLIGLEEIREQVANKGDTKRWKEYILKQKGVVDNLVDILDDMYPTFLDNETLQEDFTAKQVLSVIGNRWSPEWDKFVVSVLNAILDHENFDTEVLFDDTSGGEDEYIWEVAYDIIKTRLT